MSQRLTTLRVMSDEFFQNFFSEHKIAISTLQFALFFFYIKPQLLRDFTIQQGVVIVFFLFLLLFTVLVVFELTLLTSY